MKELWAWVRQWFRSRRAHSTYTDRGPIRTDDHDILPSWVNRPAPGKELD